MRVQMFPWLLYHHTLSFDLVSILRLVSDGGRLGRKLKKS